MSNPLTHALDIGAFAVWLTMTAAGTIGIMVREIPQQTAASPGGKSSSAGPVFLLRETRSGKSASTPPTPSRPSLSTTAGLPAPPELPASAKSYSLPVVPDFPAGSGAAPGRSVQARLAAGDTPGPVYPPYSRRDGQTGTAVVQFTVDASGRVRDASIYTSSGWNLLDREAVRTVLSWRYPPGEPLKLVRPIVFRLP